MFFVLVCGKACFIAPNGRMSRHLLSLTTSGRGGGLISASLLIDVQHAIFPMNYDNMVLKTNALLF